MVSNDTTHDDLQTFEPLKAAGKPVCWVLNPRNWASLPFGEQESLSTRGCAPAQQVTLAGHRITVGVWFGALTFDVREWMAVMGMDNGQDIPEDAVAADFDRLAWTVFPMLGHWSEISRQVVSDVLPIFRGSVWPSDRKKWQRSARRHK